MYVLTKIQIRSCAVKTSTSVPPGFKEIDDLTSCFHRSDLIIIAAQPSICKTEFALAIVRKAALKGDLPVAFFSLEMSKEQLSLRMLASEARVDSQRLRKGLLGGTDWPKLANAARRLSQVPIFIDDTQFNVLELKAKVRRLKAEFGLGLIIVDSLQLVQNDELHNTHEQKLSDICRSLKATATEFDLPIIVLYQVSSRPECRKNQSPCLGDIAEDDGASYADIVLFIHRDHIYHRSTDTPEREIAEIIIEKNKNGAIGSVKLFYDGEFHTFE